jgi:hypothetical protein
MEKPRPVPDGMRQLEDFTRRVLSVPKKEIDAKMLKEKKQKARKRTGDR